ncbi:type I pullulanase [Salisediminibacterium selenitireducens]|uniref:Pullulanase, type I n=1 Tax=Bacillus selenitireducens (strain ATCC 700615 / DSM 15326 / MLS10) TaxID=439292 RepID=D6XSI0_BACIE|nr:type I pullulanase [Salisediminibacterium selenitireducens]ADH98766.1 pullulanase, type I [[Bacillus] selenitireducens MLS10]
MRNVMTWVDSPHDLQLNGAGIEQRVHVHQKAMLYSENEVIEATVMDTYENGVHLVTSKKIIPGKRMTLGVGRIKAPVSIRFLVHTEWFHENYSDTSEVFGAIYTAQETIFRVWSPVAVTMELLINGRAISMNRSWRGSWEVAVPGDCHGDEYLFRAEVNGVVHEVVDPYAKALTANSKAGVVVDLTRTDPKEFRSTDRPEVRNLQDSIIYELHVRDATIHPDSGVKAKGTYSGLTETGTTTEKGFKTGLDYLTDLGMTHVQLLPVNDFGRVDDLKPSKQYNWGYDPLFFQVPEGSFSTDPTNPFARITELKELVQAFHRKGIQVILDVVYNHVFVLDESSFHKLVPYYYFRYSANGEPSNGTGVGNDIASERPMVRAFILDTVRYWLKEFRIDGFRFDLMGIMDIDTVNAIRHEADKEPRPVMLLGEGWNLPTELDFDHKATNHRAGEMPGVRFFNDMFRDTIKGSTFDLNEQGYATGRGKWIERMYQLTSGSVLMDEPLPPHVAEITQTVNYVECHDNHTLWDRLLISNQEDSVETRQALHRLATAITIFSQGVPFLHAGQEFFRTKGGDGNSYISPDEVNRLDWNLAEEASENIRYIRDLIALRRSRPGFRQLSASAFRERTRVLQTEFPVFGYILFEYEEEIVIFFNPGDEQQEVHLPSVGQWQVLSSPYRSAVITEPSMLGLKLDMKPFECLVLGKKR